MRAIRTELMRSSNSAAIRSYRDNTNVIKGVMRQAAGDRNTCAACISLDGTFYPLSHVPDDHPLGRCIWSPVTKTWKELGKDLQGLGVTKQNIFKGLAEDKFPRKLGYDNFKTFTNAEKASSFSNKKMHSLFNDWERKGFGREFMDSIKKQDVHKQWWIPKSAKEMARWNPN